MANVHIDATRHREIFDPEKFNIPVQIIGCGAVGSWVALMLAKLGISDIHVWDFDHVEQHNIANQLFGNSDVGKKKVVALADAIYKQTGMDIIAHCEKVVSQPMYGVVFNLVDSMAARKEIWDNCLKYKGGVQRVIETRMGVDVGRVYNVGNMNPMNIKDYEGTLYGDDVAEVSACGTSLTVITSALSVASCAVRGMINWHTEKHVDNEILMDFIYNNTFATRWE